MTELPNSTYADYNAGPLYTADQMHAYADAENAALREINSALCTKSNGYVADNARLSERVKVLEDALRDIAYTTDGVDCNAHARAALEAAK